MFPQYYCTNLNLDEFTVMLFLGFSWAVRRAAVSNNRMPLTGCALLMGISRLVKDSSHPHDFVRQMPWAPWAQTLSNLRHCKNCGRGGVGGGMDVLASFVHPSGKCDSVQRGLASVRWRAGDGLPVSLISLFRPGFYLSWLITVLPRALSPA